MPCRASTGSAIIKGAVKLHVGLEHEGLLPAFVAITDGKTHDLTAARALQLPSGSIVVMDRGYTDYAWYNQMNNNDISLAFVPDTALPPASMQAGLRRNDGFVWIPACAGQLWVTSATCYRLGFTTGGIAPTHADITSAGCNASPGTATGRPE